MSEERLPDPATDGERLAYALSMHVLLAILLLIGAVFNVLTWPAFLRRVAKDPRARDESGRMTRFFTVHIVLVAAALAIAAVSAVAAVVALVVGG